MAWVGAVTWTVLLARLRVLLNEPATAISDANLMTCCNAAIGSARGKLVVPKVKSTLTMTTGTWVYSVPTDFVAIDFLMDASKSRIPDYAWDLVPGNDAEFVFRSPYFTPTTASDLVVYGYKVQPEVTVGGDYISIDLGYVLAQTLANAHALFGGGGSQLSAWHLTEHARYVAEAEARLGDAFVLRNFSPSATARWVPGRTQGQGT